jgi:hypothetical protein
MGCKTSKLPLPSDKRTAVARQFSPTHSAKSMDNGEPLTRRRVETDLCLDGKGLKTIRTLPHTKDTFEHDLKTSKVASPSSDTTLSCFHRKMSNLSVVGALLTFMIHAIIIFIGEFIVGNRAAASMTPDAQCQQHQTDDETDLILKASLLNIKGEVLEKERLRLAAIKRYAESIGLSQPNPYPHVVDMKLKVHKKRSKI